jgi:hypothetical protein
VVGLQFDETGDRSDARLPIAVVAITTIFVILLSMFALLTYGWQKCAQSSGLLSSGLPCVASAPPAAGWKPTPEAQKEIPAEILALYIAAGQRFKVAWPVLAGIGKLECDHARSTLTGCRSGQNFAGAMGPMQFLAGTWEAERAAAPGHTNPSVYDPGDAIFSAANYLAKMGAAGVMDIDSSPVSSAIFGYNHSREYVAGVLANAHRYATRDLGATIGAEVSGVADVLEKLAPMFSWVPPGGFPGTRFYRGFEEQCTYFAAYQWPGRNGQGVTWSDNASGWIANARQQGYQISSTPSVGAIAVWYAQPGYSQFGHLGIVASVTSNSYTVAEQNYKGPGIIDQRRISWPDPKVAGFIPVPGGTP